MHSPLLTMELDFILSDIRSGGKLGKLRSWTSFGCLRETVGKLTALLTYVYVLANNSFSDNSLLSKVEEHTNEKTPIPGGGEARKLSTL